jgi:HSP20 family protein
MLSRRDPFRDMFEMRRAMDRLMENPFSGSEDFLQTIGMDVPMDVSETDDAYMVKASLPGIKPEDIDITYSGNTLTVRGETQSDQEREGERYHVRERRFGSFSRTITLPTLINANSIDAKYQDGTLTLHLPKAEESKPRHIQIKSGGSSKVIEAQARESRKRSK